MVNPSELADPLLILAPPRSFSWVVCAMLGEHPQMYALPELHLFSAETVSQWWELCSQETFNMDHGLLRVVAQLFFTKQTEQTVKLAGGWLRRRSYFTTGFLLEVLAERVHPLILVEKSPSVVYRIEFLQRAFSMFPHARFIHLVRHPRAYCESVMGAVKDLSKSGPIPPLHWLLHLASFPHPSTSKNETWGATADLDPQRGWHVLNANIREFLESVPDHQKVRIRGEDLLTDPDRSLREITGWMGLRTDADAIEAMKHPKRSLYASLGPPGASFGSDYFFFQRPGLDSDLAEFQNLDGPVSWRADGQGFLPEVKELAQEFGYQ
jgi:hypothetical protein